MKASNVLASVLFSAIAAAVPFDKRALVTSTEIVTETVIIYTTVYGDEAPIAPATTTPGLFFEKPKSSKVVPSPTSVYTPPVVVAPRPSSAAAPAPAPSSIYTPPAPSSQYVPPVPQVPSSAVVVPAPVPTSVYVPPAPAPAPPSPSAVVPQPSSAPAPAPPTAPPTGKKYHGDITVYDSNGDLGSCGEPLYNTNMTVALATPTYGASTYDVMTGKATNLWCGQEITIEYQGKQVKAKVMDSCPGCADGDIDLSHAVWKELTGLDELTRKEADWWKS